MSYNFDGLRVLVVDDNLHMRALLCRILQAFGIKTIYDASNAHQAWEIFTINPCDILLVDWVLEGMNGIELTEKVRNSPDSPNPFIPIIMVSGYTNLECVHAARDAGVTEFLAKPVSSKAILSRLTAVIENPRPFVRTKTYFGPCRRRRNDPMYRGPERRVADLVTIDDDTTDAASPARPESS
jgi:two-component system chemotaxis response regulator CheY